MTFELEWVSIYSFQCRRMEKFRHNRVIFAGDSAHQVSPFGALGANSGVQDTDNLAWKLKLVIEGTAPESLLDSYDNERILGADENILNSSRSTDFITPKSDMSRILRDAVLDLSEHYEFARPLVNSGRLSVPCVYDGSALNTPDALPDGSSRSRPGATCADAPLDDDHLLSGLDGRFTMLTIGADAPESLPVGELTVDRLAVQATPEIRKRYLGDAGAAVYLIRPDQHVAARWSAYDETAVQTAVARAIGRE